MMVKTLTVTEEAYRRLASRKKEGESFSKIIIRLTGSGQIRDLVGILSPAQADRLEASIAEGRRRMRKGMDHL
ncbi:MAG: antitoxin VapB family protein [Candidatus Aenigmarchaeota archaeon]|nr:antitoxin VapB family protein [Candidatus Aenigmarchaeota archaeon]